MSGGNDTLDQIIQYVPDILVGLLVLGLGALIPYIYRFIRLYRVNLKLRGAWKGFSDALTFIVVGRFMEFKHFEASGFLGVGDARALSELSFFLSTYKTFNYEVAYADELSGENTRNNMILLGGPDANQITKLLLDKMYHNIKRGNEKDYIISFADGISNKVYAPRFSDKDSKNGIDYGYIIRGPNPLDEEKYVLIVVGCFGYGTWGCVRHLVSDAFKNDRFVRSNKSFEMIIESTVVKGVPLSNKVVLKRSLRKAEPATKTS